MVAEKLIELEETDSTNTWLKECIRGGEGAPEPVHGLVVAARNQRSGRGQRGNTWESSPGENLTLSVLLSPTALIASEQFAVSEVVALATARTVSACLGDTAGVSVSVKWPNDIYVGDKKIAGILIENVMSGNRILWSVCGIGLNVNQTQFHSDAPNPVSMAMLTGRRYSLSDVRHLLITQLLSLSERYLQTPGASAISELHTLYSSQLWRREGVWPWYDNLTDTPLQASIAMVAPTGHLTLRLTDRTLRTYAFKEVTPLLSPTPSDPIIHQ